MSSLIKVITPICDVKADLPVSQVVISGALQVTDTINTAQSFQLTPSVPISALWTINPPSNQTLINRQIFVRSYLQFDFDVAPQIGTNDALASLPFNNLIDVATVTINGEATSENISDKLQAFMCYGNDANDRKNSLSLSAAMPDSYQAYSDWSVYGTAKSPLAFYGENSSEPTRGGFPYTQISPTRYQFEVVEPLFLSPLCQFGEQQEGMCNVNQLSVNLRFKSNTSRAWSHSSLGNAMTSAVCTFYQAPELLIQYSTPAMLERLPLVQSLPYVKSNEYVKAVPTLTAGSSTTVISDTIRLSQVPRSIYLFCRRSDATTTFLTPQSFLKINNISVSWGNQSSLFAQTTSQGLYNMSAQNGLNYDYSGWNKYRGGVVRIDLCKDLGLLDSESVGVQGSYNIQVQMSVTNTSAANYDAQFYMCVLNTGIFSIGQNSARASLGNLTPQLVLQAKEQEGMDYHEFRRLQGGSFWSSLKNIVGKVARGVSDVAGYVKYIPGPIGEIASTIGSVAGPLASGLGAGYVGGRMVGGSRLVGGRRK